MKKDRWYTRLGKLWMLVGRLIGYVVIASVPIVATALLSILVWALLIGPALQAVISNFSIASAQKEYLVYAIGQLADWTWRVILLGSFVVVVYERIKRHDTLDSKREAILTQVRQVRLTRNWKQLDDLYQELIALGSEAESRELCREMAAAFHERATDPNHANWDAAYRPISDNGWLEIAAKLDPTNEKAKLFLSFRKNITSNTQEHCAQAVNCIKEIPPELLMSFMSYHAKSIHFGSELNAELKRELDEIIHSKKPEHEDYLLYAILKRPLPLSRETKEFLERRKIDQELFREGALDGRAEQESGDFAQFDLSQIVCTKETKPKWDLGVVDFIEPALQCKHLFVLGEPGDGKTFLNRQLEHFALKIDPRWIVVGWSAFLPLLEEKQMTVHLILKSFVRDLRTTLAKDKRFQELVRLKKGDDLADWREQVLELKEMLRAKSIAGIFVTIDNLDKYPEFRRENRNLILLVTSLIRPEIVEEAPPCYLRLYMEPASYRFLDPGSSPWSLMEPIRLTWNVEQKKKILKHRAEAIRIDLDLNREEDLERLALQASSLRDLIRQFHASERREYEQYLQESGVPLTA